MFENARSLLSDKLVSLMTKIYIASLLLFMAIFVWKWPQLPRELPLFYSLPKSPEQLATPHLLMILPLFSFLFFFINLLTAAFLHTNEKLAAILLVIAGTVSSLLLLTTFIKIIFL